MILTAIVASCYTGISKEISWYAMSRGSTRKNPRFFPDLGCRKLAGNGKNRDSSRTSDAGSWRTTEKSTIEGRRPSYGAPLPLRIYMGVRQYGFVNARTPLSPHRIVQIRICIAATPQVPNTNIILFFAYYIDSHCGFCYTGISKEISWYAMSRGLARVQLDTVFFLGFPPRQEVLWGR